MHIIKFSNVYFQAVLSVELPIPSSAPVSVVSVINTGEISMLLVCMVYTLFLCCHFKSCVVRTF